MIWRTRVCGPVRAYTHVNCGAFSTFTRCRDAVPLLSRRERTVFAPPPVAALQQLVALVQAHYPDFLDRRAQQDRAVPEYVRDEFEEHLRCDVPELRRPAHGQECAASGGGGVRPAAGAAIGAEFPVPIALPVRAPRVPALGAQKLPRRRG